MVRNCTLLKSKNTRFHGPLILVITVLCSTTLCSTTSTAQNSASSSSLPEQNEPTAPAPDLNRGLVGYYPFEEDARDHSGHENHGTSHGVVAYGSGSIGKALQLQGDDDRGFITIPHSESLTFERAATFGCWFFLNEGAGQTGENRSIGKVERAHQVLVAKHGDIAGFSLLSLAEGLSNRHISVIGSNGKPGEVGAAFPPDQPLRQWQHVATVADETEVRLYLNGKLRSAVRGTLDFHQINRFDVFVGINGPAEDNSDPTRFLWFPLHGAVDELRIYNRAISPQEVRLLASRDTTEPDKPVEEPVWNGHTFPPFSPEQVTGLPDTPNRHANARTAWAAEMPDQPSEWLILEYANAVHPKAVLVYEASNGGAITGLSVFNPEGEEVNVWSGRTLRTTTRGTIIPSVLEFNVPFQTNRIRLTLNPESRPGWNQIDAVGLRDISGDVQWATKATASSARIPEAAD